MSNNSSLQTDRQTVDSIVVTDRAVAQLKQIASEQNKADHFLRLNVISGGCSGMSYTMEFDDQPNQSDHELDFDGLSVRVDSEILEMLQGSTIDYENALVGGGFKFSNPNARRSCGCGSSFSC